MAIVIRNAARPAVAAVPTDPTPNGSAPSISSPMTAAASTIASTEARPCSDQYTSSRCKIRANSSSTSAAPTPNSAPRISHHGDCQPAGANASRPATNMSIAPNTTWWTCTSPVEMLPGHHDTWARIIRTLSRINRNVRMNATSRKNSACLPGCMMYSTYRSATTITPPGRTIGNSTVSRMVRPVNIEVFSTDWSFGGGQDECRFGDGADSLRAQADAVERLPAGLEQRDPAFTLGAQAADELVAGEVVRVQVAALGRRQHAGTGTVVALVGQRGQAQQGSRGVQRAEEAGGTGSGQVVRRAGLHVGDRDRMPVGVADDLHGAAVGSVLAGVPQVMAGV